MSGDNLTRLAHVLGMMGSDHDGEVLNAARHAERIRKSMDKSWGSIIAGISDNARGNDMMRAIRAEARAAAAEARANLLQGHILTLQREIAELRRKRASSPGSAGPRSSRARRTTYSIDLDPDIENQLVAGLRQRARSAEWVHRLTGWQRPMHLSVRLTRIGAKHGLSFSKPRRGFYCFTR